jgi:hypothetical protein
VYCLCRERWEPNGQDAFSVEHIQARATHPRRAGDYDNLLYSCSVCNACRRQEPLPFDPTAVSLAAHLQIRAGAVEALTREGHHLSDLCHLNRPRLVEFRRYLEELIDHLLERDDSVAERALRRILGFPVDLPDLRSRRPPGGNTRPAGITRSWFERRKQGKLPPPTKVCEAPASARCSVHFGASARRLGRHRACECHVPPFRRSGALSAHPDGAHVTMTGANGGEGR